jgi:hypothetical protein
MYEYFAYVDESTAKRYRLCLVAIPTKSLTTIHSQLMSLVLPGQRQIHMSKESDRRRREILNAILNNPSWRAVVVQSAWNARIDNQTRQQLFLLAATQPIWQEIRHLVIERSTHNQRDARTLFWIREKISNRFDFVFSDPKDEAGLWVADILAWAYSKGGSWRTMTQTRIEVLTAP